MGLTLKKKPKAKPPGMTMELPARAGLVASIDPGLGGTGWALWDPVHWADAVPPLLSGAVELHGANLRLPWVQRAELIAGQLREIFRDSHVTCGFLELPEFMLGGVGITAASRGDLIKLAITAGVIAARCFYVNVGMCVPVPVTTWKGQLPKEVTAKRAGRTIGRDLSFTTTHEADAIALGLFCKGHFA